MDQEELFRRLAVALAIGLLIGLERGWQTREESDHQRTAGLRTFALTGLLGGICGLMSTVSSPIVLAAGLLAFTGALAAFSYLEAKADNNFSVTGVVAGILTFVLGAYATLGNETVAVATAVTMAILLALREPLHSWVRNVTWPEMRSVLVLLAMSFLLLPILPNRPIDPWNVLNPSEIWLLAILIAAVSLRRLCRRPRPGRAHRHRGGRHRGGLGLLDRNDPVIRPAGPGASRKHASAGRRRPAGRRDHARARRRARRIAQARTDRHRAVAGCGSSSRSPDGCRRRVVGEGEAAPPNTLNCRSRIRSTSAPSFNWPGSSRSSCWWPRVWRSYAGNAGLFLLAAVSAIADVDALTISMARLAGLQVAAGDAASAILVAASVNTASKAAIAAFVGGARIGTIVGSASVLAIAALAVAYFALR